jgi:hypothetical protein
MPAKSAVLHVRANVYVCTKCRRRLTALHRRRKGPSDVLPRLRWRNARLHASRSVASKAKGCVLASPPMARRGALRSPVGTTLPKSKRRPMGAVGWTPFGGQYAVPRLSARRRPERQPLHLVARERSRLPELRLRSSLSQSAALWYRKPQCGGQKLTRPWLATAVQALEASNHPIPANQYNVKVRHYLLRQVALHL